MKVLERAQAAKVPRTGSHAGTRALWLRSEVDVRVEKGMLLLLAVAAVIGITYGFSCLMDLVQNWAVMERGIANLI